MPNTNTHDIPRPLSASSSRYQRDSGSTQFRNVIFGGIYDDSCCSPISNTLSTYQRN
ncbi:hypothetical protein BofuT4_uP121000.1 [Botrytis cinerea T4]|uniref:Uncharacterized protein n=1 Tax=Botryotinia fuckeliana (strain T4) TaxID=999810 RepID=G2YN83_BOTF4|nr:hypothetical protein BofuT4_uP121000.1 [Botrytis cinerea T4]